MTAVFQEVAFRPAKGGISEAETRPFAGRKATSWKGIRNPAYFNAISHDEDDAPD